MHHCPNKGLPMPRFHASPERPSQKQEGRNTRQRPQQPIDEFNPCVQGIKYGVAVFVVGSPVAGIPLLRKVFCKDCFLGHPKGIVCDQHPARLVGRSGPPCNFFGLSGWNHQPKTFRPVWTSHARPGHANHASSEHDQKGHDHRNANQPPKAS